MKRLRLAIIGFGRVGRACAEAILAGDDSALPLLRPGAHSLVDVPLSFLWGDLRDKAEREWM